MVELADRDAAGSGRGVVGVVGEGKRDGASVDGEAATLAANSTAAPNVTASSKSTGAVNRCVPWWTVLDMGHMRIMPGRTALTLTRSARPAGVAVPISLASRSLALAIASGRFASS